MFPMLRKEELDMLKDQAMLKSAAELEKEASEAQSAKLHELIRRGTPAALAEANDLMKIMTGYDREAKVDFDQVVESELDKVKQKAEELTLQIRGGQKSGKKLDELAGQVKSAQGRLAKMIEKEEDEAVMRKMFIFFILCQY